MFTRYAAAPTLAVFMAGPAGALPQADNQTTKAAPMTHYQNLTALDGTPIDGAKLAGKVVLFVNVASRCGYTNQYAGLQALYADNASKGLVIVGVPCNQFGGQEPGSAGEIERFCSMDYGVEFPLLEKQDVNGTNRTELYDWLVGDGADVSWNFEKFLVGRHGDVLGRFPSGVTPNDAVLVHAIKSALDDD